MASLAQRLGFGRTAEPTEKKKADRRPRKSKLRENAESIGTALLLFLIVRAFFLQAFRIPSESMEDTLLKGDFLFVNKMLYGAKIPFTDARLPDIREIQAGDVIVFKNPVDRKTDFIKRCVAVGGDTVMVRGNTLYVNGEAQHHGYEKYAGGASRTAANWPPEAPYYVVPEDHFFAMGDNRNNSRDSRFFRRDGRVKGRQVEPAVPNDLLVGKAMFIYASFNFDKYFLPRFNRMFRAVR